MNEIQARGIIFNIKKYAIHDGPGIRTTVFFKGCPLACPWCHNPEGRLFSPQKLKKIIRKNSGEPLIREETIGREISVAELIHEMEKDLIFYDESGGGVTFSGGDPLAQPIFLRALLNVCRKRGIHSAVDTTGYASAHTVREIAEYADLFLYDLKIMDEENHIRHTGVSNCLILENLKMLSRMGKEIMIRFPLIPGFTDDGKNIKSIAQYVSGLGTIREMAVLPFHNIAEGKYLKLENRNPMKGIMPPDGEYIQKICQEFESYGFSVHIGG